MIRIAGINIPDNKHIGIALTNIFGIGRSRAHEVLGDIGIDVNTQTKDISDAEIAKLRVEIEKKYRVEGELRHEVRMNIKRLRETKCYRGLRHNANLPARGQRTKTNSRTVRGNKRMTMGSGRRSVSKT